MIGHPGPRAIGIVVVGIGVAVALEARTFNVNFLTDPLGPKALPWLVAALFGAAGLALSRRQRGHPTRELGEPAEPEASATSLGPVAAAGGVFLAWSLTLVPLGFALSTPLAVAALARLFGGNWKGGLLTGAVLTTLLWVLFAMVLALPLPQGSLWMR